MRVVIGEDLVLLRDGPRRRCSPTTATRSSPRSATATRCSPPSTSTTPELAIIDVRMPPTQTDEGVRAAVEVRRRHARRGDPHPQPVRRGALRLRPARRRQPGRRLPAQGPRRRRRASSSPPLRRVAAGGTAIDPEVVAQLLSRRRRTDVLDELTPREREVLGLMAEGHSNGAIAERLVVTNGAVEKHVTRGVHEARAAADRPAAPPRARRPHLPGGLMSTATPPPSRSPPASAARPRRSGWS